MFLLKESLLLINYYRLNWMLPFIRHHYSRLRAFHKETQIKIKHHYLIQQINPNLQNFLFSFVMILYHLMALFQITPPLLIPLLIHFQLPLRIPLHFHFQYYFYYFVNLILIKTYLFNFARVNFHLPLTHLRCLRFNLV